MQEINKQAILRAKELLSSGEVNRVIGWKKGDFCYDESPATFTLDNVEEMVYTDFSSPNVSKYLIAESLKEGKVLVFLKPCDTYSFNQLIKEHRIKREKVYVIAIGCNGKLDIDKIRSLGVESVLDAEIVENQVKITTLYGDKTISKQEIMLEKCLTCKSKKHAVADEYLGESSQEESNDRFSKVKELEAMTEQERYAFWQQELSKCIRCNACRNVCPACSCVNCVFDNPNSNVDSKANSNEFEEKLFHIIRAWHVAGRCTDCGECSRVCPQGIPLHLINRKFIKDMNEFYGEYQAGADLEAKAPLNSYKTEDREPCEFDKKEGK